MASQGRFTWRHDQVLRCLTLAMEDKRNRALSCPQFHKNITHKKLHSSAQESNRQENVLKPSPAEDNWTLLADVCQRLIFPPMIATTNFRPIVLCSGSARLVLLLALTVPWADAVHEAYESENLRSAELVTEAEDRGWRVRIYPVEIV